MTDLSKEVKSCPLSIEVKMLCDAGYSFPPIYHKYVQLVDFLKRIELKGCTAMKTYHDDDDVCLACNAQTLLQKLGEHYVK